MCVQSASRQKPLAFYRIARRARARSGDGARGRFLSVRVNAARCRRAFEVWSCHCHEVPGVVDSQLIPVALSMTERVEITAHARLVHDMDTPSASASARASTRLAVGACGILLSVQRCGVLSSRGSTDWTKLEAASRRAAPHLEHASARKGHRLVRRERCAAVASSRLRTALVLRVLLRGFVL